MRYVVASSAEAEVSGLFHNGKTAVPLLITLYEIVSPQPQTPIKTDKTVAEVIVTAKVRQKSSKVTDM